MFEKPKNNQPFTIPKGKLSERWPQELTEEEKTELGLGKRESEKSAFSVLRASWKNPENQIEQEIEIDVQKEIKFFEKLYGDNLGMKIDREKILSIWNKNQEAIKREIETYGYDTILIVPDNLPSESEVNAKVIETIDEGAGKGKVAGTFYGEKQQSISSVKGDKYRIILVHSAQNLADNPLLKATKGKNIMALTGLKQQEVEEKIAKKQELTADFKINVGGQVIEIKADSLSSEEYEIFQRVYFEKTLEQSGGQAGKHLDASGWTWLMNSRSGSRVVDAGWHPGSRRLYVDAYDPDTAHDALGLRLSRSFS